MVSCSKTGASGDQAADQHILDADGQENGMLSAKMRSERIKVSDRIKDKKEERGRGLLMRSAFLFFFLDIHVETIPANEFYR